MSNRAQRRREARAARKQGQAGTALRRADVAAATGTPLDELPGMSGFKGRLWARQANPVTVVVRTLLILGIAAGAAMQMWPVMLISGLVILTTPFWLPAPSDFTNPLARLMLGEAVWDTIAPAWQKIGHPTLMIGAFGGICWGLWQRDWLVAGTAAGALSAYRAVFGAHCWVLSRRILPMRDAA